MSDNVGIKVYALIIENDSILVVENKGAKGLEYNLPAGEVQQNESVIDAVKREVKKQTLLDIEVGPLAFVYEYAPHLNPNRYGDTHNLHLTFECNINDQFFELSKSTTLIQKNIKWININDLNNLDEAFQQNITGKIIAYIGSKKNNNLIKDFNQMKYELV
ncbi:NUDIX domain-containing protein [Niallia taxi]|uniref:NUDIX domain-containing protein n=1 Tax=Niallia taxi TaxID=2499688 RepID=UPI002040BAB9|nr:NUDIX domain-containing protein [Niallia taxi]MCM3216682.1 NUDIX domain-containing protein [Niallia taxi]